MKIAKVIIDLSLDKGFDYYIPDNLSGQIHVGSQVNVPFGRSMRHGYVLAIGTHTSYNKALKSIASLCEKHTKIPEPLVKLGEWMADYYCCSQEQAVRTLLPRAVRSGKVKHKTLKLYSITDSAETEKFIIKYGEKKPSQGQIAILRTLLIHQQVSQDQLLAEAGVTASPLKTLLTKKLVTMEEVVVRRNPYDSARIMASEPQEPTAEQQAALEQIYEKLNHPEKGHTILLHGVTSSGKTEVYLQAIAKAMKMGRDSIVLVPEISLTPQTVRRFRARFGDMISVLHSRLTEGERFDEWTRVSEGKVQIAVGARSALFAPFRNLGLIIVDEEHENSYKQGEAPRYHARDVAVVRAHFEKCVVILGSATPSFESYANTINGKYSLIEMNKRIDDRLLPTMKVVDMRLGSQETGKASIFSKILVDAVYDRLYKGEQTILFLNRRGFARQMLCEQCGYVAECPNCSIPYTYHKKRETLTCHLCGDVIKALLTCPECTSPEIRYSGIGTEKIESMARAVFKDARIIRMDSDTMHSAASYETALDSFRRGEIDILIGTQMIAKGLHFPKVTLVGIINADQSMYIPDFRAPERTFQLLTQVAGRAGRGDISGEVLIQTFNPDNDTIRYATRNEYKTFYEDDMEVRKMLSYPPEGHLIAIHFRGEDQNAACACAYDFFERIKPACHPEVIVTEPEPAPIERIKKKWRYMIMFRGPRLKLLRQKIRYEVLHGQRPKDIDIYVDVDAISLM
jgi:primosomal protein N' (replication factor Y) (superfamily II helicase)